jgi:hypothetical protein
MDQPAEPPGGPDIAAGFPRAATIVRRSQPIRSPIARASLPDRNGIVRPFQTDGAPTHGPQKMPALAQEDASRRSSATDDRTRLGRRENPSGLKTINGNQKIKG